MARDRSAQLDPASSQPIGASQIREAPMEDEAPPHSDAHPADSLLITGIMTGRLGGSERDSYRGKDQ